MFIKYIYTFAQNYYFIINANFPFQNIQFNELYILIPGGA